MVNPGPTGCFVLNHSTDPSGLSRCIIRVSPAIRSTRCAGGVYRERSAAVGIPKKKEVREVAVFLSEKIRVFMWIPINFIKFGGLEHEWMMFPYVSISYMGCHPKPIDELTCFKMVIAPPTSIYIYPY
jgi:hypothetical protein